MKKRIYIGESTKNGELKYLVVFDDQATAEKWLKTEEFDFREREIISKTEAIRRHGKKSVENAYTGIF